MHAIAAGQIKSLAEARKLIKKSFKLKKYTPDNTELWDSEYKKIKNIF